MKLLIAICVCALAVPLTAQTNLQTFTSPDSAFQFKYSPALIHCTQRPFRNGQLGWIEDSCSSQGDICDNDAATGVNFVCLAYPKDKLKDKPGFIAAVFFVRSDPDATTQKTCLERSENWSAGDAVATKINGISAKLFHTTDGWAGGADSGEIYRVFHGNKCYELGIVEGDSNEGKFDPGTFEEYTAHDAAKVRASLKQPLNSFRFLK